MYNLIRNPGFRRHLLPEAGAMSVSIIIAEFLYKFHSFTLECLAFLVTWFAVSGLVSWARQAWFGSAVDEVREAGQ